MPETPVTPTSAAAAPGKGRVFAMRLTSTLILWAVLSLAFYFHVTPLIVGFTALFGIAGTWEYYRLQRDDVSFSAFGRFGILLSVAYWVIQMTWLIRRGSVAPMWLDVATLMIALQGAFLLCYRHSLEGIRTLQRVFSVVFGTVYTVIGFAFLARIATLGSHHSGMSGLHLVLLLTMMTKFCDMGAYAFGVLWGKHKMIPHISPAKSWEGLGGAVVGGIVALTAMMFSVPDLLHPIHWTHGFILVPLLCFVGVTGDLAESVIKRCLAIKDSGHSLPGIGGILDLTDSLIFTAPVFYFYVSAIAGFKL